MTDTNMARDVEVYDSALLGILSQEKNIENFLNVIHGFLLRKTDFFIIKENDDDRMGFHPGQAFNILRNSFGKFEHLAAQRTQEASRRKALEEKEKKKNQNMPASKENAPTDPKEAAVDPLRGEGDQAAAAASDKGAGAAAEPSTAELPSKTPQPSGQSDHPSEQSSSADQAPVPESSDAPSSNASKEGDAAAESKTNNHDKSKNGEEEEDPQVVAERRALQANPETYNGADRDSYRWSQSIMEVDVYVKVPEGIKKGSMVKVKSERKHLKVTMMTPDRQWQVLVDGELTWEVKSDACWTLVPSKHVHISMEKREERWWEALLVGEPKINTRKIDCSRPMTDLDDEAQAKIGELMYNQRQKELGLPQSHEQKTYKILQEAWNAPGSPFAGRPFDPSLVSVNPSGVVNMK